MRRLSYDVRSKSSFFFGGSRWPNIASITTKASTVTILHGICPKIYNIFIFYCHADTLTHRLLHWFGALIAYTIFTSKPQTIFNCNYDHTQHWDVDLFICSNGSVFNFNEKTKWNSVEPWSFANFYPRTCTFNEYSLCASCIQETIVWVLFLFIFWGVCVMCMSRYFCRGSVFSSLCLTCSLSHVVYIEESIRLVDFSLFFEVILCWFLSNNQICRFRNEDLTN